MKNLIDKLENGTAKVGVIGLGYVGLPLAITFAEKLHVIGCDLNSSILNCLVSGRSHILGISDESVKAHLNKSFFPTDDYGKLAESDFIIICVPTPLAEDKLPDLSYIKGACECLCKIIKKNHFIILESTTYPGTTDEVVVRILEKSGLKAGTDFGVAYSPERIDPGNQKYTVENTPKVVGGITDECTRIAKALYEVAGIKIVPVKDPRTAEAVKMVENIFRNVNIALVNELALIFEKMGIDAWEVIDAASTKPYGFLPFYPGPGIGGHCIPLDPYYMSYISKRHDFIPRFIEIAGEINEFMKIHVIYLVEESLKKSNKNLYGSTIAILGLSYKKNIDDTRESPAVDIIDELVSLGAKVRTYDPYVNQLHTRNGNYLSELKFEDALKGADCAVFLVDHDAFKDLEVERFLGLMSLPIVIDCKNLFRHIESSKAIYMGIGKANRLPSH